MLKGRTVLVTGGASGIGAATSKKLAEEGANVVVADVQDSRGNDIASSLGAQGHYVHCDVTVEEQAAEAVAAAVSQFGALHGVVTSAGALGPVCAIEDTDMEAYTKHQALNTAGTLVTIKHAARAMKNNPMPQRGAIVSISSVCGTKAGTAPTSYTMSKYAVVGLVAQAAAELGQLGIRANAVAPGTVSTPLVSRWLLGDENKDCSEALAAAAPNPEDPLTMDHVTSTIAFLLSTKSGGINGQTLVLDQGFYHLGMMGKAFPQIRDPDLPVDIGNAKDGDQEK